MKKKHKLTLLKLSIERSVLLMGVCPVCNGIETITYICRICNETVSDAGRVMDFYDDYSAYMDIDEIKLVDGFPTSVKNGYCPHLYYCQACGYEEVRIIHT